MRAIVNIDVPDLARGIAFYGAALGLRLARQLGDGVAELAGASCDVYLLQRPAGSAPTSTGSPARTYARHWTPVHLDFVVDDLEAATTRALDAGAVQESACTHWRGSRCITFADPFGHGFCLIAFARGTYDDEE